LHFADNSNPLDKGDENYDRLSKICTLFHFLNERFAAVYHHTENLTVAEVIVMFKGKVVLRQYIPTKKGRDVE
jgi:hypothetical protein